MIIKFILYCVIIAISLLLILFINNMGTISTYGKRIAQDVRTYDDFRYYTWLQEKAQDLEELYEQEFCECMKLAFEDFCLAIYTGNFQITYKT